MEPALAGALQALLRPLAELALAKGMPFQAAQELFKQAYVDAAAAMPAEGPAHRQVSRISTATGLQRREVARLMQVNVRTSAPRRSMAVDLFTRWMADASCRDVCLPRQGDAPSFEALARDLTRDVHPRSLLEELVRLKLVSWDVQADTVRLQADAFVPRDDQARMLGFLADNVGDHFKAAVSNVVGGRPAHFEQAIFADELSTHSLALLRPLISAQWKALAASLVPALERLIAEDEQAGRAQDQRLRIGLYEYHTPMAQVAVPPPEPAAAPAPTSMPSPATSRARKA